LRLYYNYIGERYFLIEKGKIAQLKTHRALIAIAGKYTVLALVEAFNP
jgi:hypothetical protein